MTSLESPHLISITNAHFGPLRGLTVILIIAGKVTNATFENQRYSKIISEVYRATGLSTRIINMPWRLVVDLDRTPPVLTDWNAAESYFSNSLQAGVNTGDPFYYRQFIF